MWRAASSFRHVFQRCTLQCGSLTGWPLWLGSALRSPFLKARRRCDVALQPSLRFSLLAQRSLLPGCRASRYTPEPSTDQSKPFLRLDLTLPRPHAKEAGGPGNVICQSGSPRLQRAREMLRIYRTRGGGGARVDGEKPREVDRGRRKKITK